MHTTQGGTGGSAARKGEKPREREKEQAKERDDKERERKLLATGRSKAQRREMHHLCSGLAALRAHHRVRVQESKREKKRGRGQRESEACTRERERYGERGREKGTDECGRETDVHPPTNTDKQRGQERTRGEPSRVALG